MESLATNVLTDNYNIVLKNSDSTWVNFPQFSQALNLVEGDNTFNDLKFEVGR